MSSNYCIPKRFYSLDALRGLAAVSVMISHWPQFFISAEKFPPSSPLVHTNVSLYTEFKLPFIDFLFVIYHMGWLAVDLFFGLSGFIFYWIYSGMIRKSSISARDFFILRVSRLYPLHVATLLWVACIQLFSHYAISTSYFFLDHNDLKQFVLNLFFASSWGIGDWHSYNTPIWSVSVEVLLYAMFFLLCRFAPLRSFFLLCISIAGLLLVYQINPRLGHGIFSFFLGGCTYRIFTWLVATSRIDSVLPYLFASTALLWVIEIIAVYHQWKNPLESLPFFWRYTFLPAILMFQLTILTLALAETKRGTLGRRISLLGDISYSIYLIHFPLQLSILTLVLYFGIGRELFFSHSTFIGYIAAVLVLSTISHYYFERPLQANMRKAWLGARV